MSSDNPLNPEVVEDHDPRSLIQAAQQGGELTDPNAQAPAYMQEDAGTGLEEVSKYISPPRIKVVQGLSRSELKAQFNEGDVIVTPANVLLAPIKLNENNKPTDEGEPFYFTPLFFFVEWIQTSPIGVQPMIRDRTFDPNSELAQKAQDQATRREKIQVDGKEIEVRNVECLNFLIAIYDERFIEMPCLLTFARGEHRTGTTFCNLVRMRRRTPIYGGVYEAKVGPRKNDQGEWYGINPQNPPLSTGQFTPEKYYEAFKMLHQDFKESHASNLILPEYDDETVEEATPNAGGKF